MLTYLDQGIRRGEILELKIRKILRYYINFGIPKVLQFSGLLLGHFVKHKPLISKERISTFYEK